MKDICKVLQVDDVHDDDVLHDLLMGRDDVGGRKANVADIIIDTDTATAYIDMLLIVLLYSLVIRFDDWRLER